MLCFNPFSCCFRSNAVANGEANVLSNNTAFSNNSALSDNNIGLVNIPFNIESPSFCSFNYTQSANSYNEKHAKENEWLPESSFLSVFGKDAAMLIMRNQGKTMEPVLQRQCCFKVLPKLDSVDFLKSKEKDQKILDKHCPEILMTANNLLLLNNIVINNKISFEKMHEFKVKLFTSDYSKYLKLETYSHAALMLLCKYKTEDQKIKDLLEKSILFHSLIIINVLNRDCLSNYITRNFFKFNSDPVDEIKSFNSVHSGRNYSFLSLI